MKLLDKLESEINDYYNQNDVIIDKFVNEIINESDFNNVNKIINFINEPASTGKNNIIYKLSAAFNNIKYKGIPLQRYIFIESYKLMTSDADNYKIERQTMLFVNDLYFRIMKYNGNNEKTKMIRYYLLMLNIIWMIDFKGSNIYFLIQSNQHDEYYNQLLFYLINRFNKKIEETNYLGYTVRIIYSSYIYGDILEYKYKNYNTLVNNIALYKLLHKTYINNKGVDEERIREILITEINNDKHIHKNYSSEESINKLVNLIKNPYSSEVEIYTIKTLGDEDETGNSNSGVTEEMIHSLTGHKKEEVIIGDLEDIIKILGGKSNDPYFFFLHDIFYNKINTFILYQLKEFEELYNLTNSILIYMFGNKSYEEQYKNKILLNNLNFVEQSVLINQKKSKFELEFNSIREKFSI